MNFRTFVSKITKALGALNFMGKAGPLNKNWEEKIIFKKNCFVLKKRYIFSTIVERVT